MELRHLRYFAAVAETRSFTQAAAECGVAQSALSQQIARLEADVGAPLFSRSPRQVRLTEAGAVLLPWARRLLSEVEQAQQDLDALAGLRRGSLRLGLIQTVSSAIDLPAILGDYRARHPGIELSVRYRTSEDLLASVLDAELDLALVGLGPERVPPGLDHHLLVAEPLVAVVSAAHRLADRRRIDLAELAGDEFIWFSRGTGLRHAVEAACARAALTPPRNLEIGLVDEMIRLAAHGIGVTLVPASTVPSPAGAETAPPASTTRPTPQTQHVPNASPTSPALHTPHTPHTPHILELTDPAAVHRVGVVHRADHLSAAATAFLNSINLSNRSNQSIQDL
jgi:DNA-binding transcriptional LysR family regulator